MTFFVEGGEKLGHLKIKEGSEFLEGKVSCTFRKGLAEVTRVRILESSSCAQPTIGNSVSFHPSMYHVVTGNKKKIHQQFCGHKKKNKQTTNQPTNQPNNQTRTSGDKGSPSGRRAGVFK